MKRNPKLNRMKVLRSAISYLIAVAMLTVSLPTSSAVAGMIPTDQVIELVSAEKPRERVMEFLGRDDIRRQMEAMGVDPGEAAVRVDSLSDAEVAQIAGRIEQLPAGQDAATAIIGAALVIFIALLITDILGYTDIFPFVTRTE